MDVKNWKWFYLKELFDIDTGKDLIYSELTVGAFPVIGHKAENNGITAMTCKLPTHKLYDYTQTISLADRGNFFATVQTHDFYVGTRVKALVSKFSVPIECLLFICVLINNEQYRFSYGRNCCDRIDAFQIKLPVDNNGNPNWQWIENYVKETLIPQLPAKTKSVWKKEFDKTPISPNKLQLNTEDWRWFRVGDLFGTDKGTIQKCKCSSATELLQDGIDIAYIGAKKSDNGIMRYVKMERELVTKGNCMVFIGDGQGSVGYSLYQPKDFIGSTTLFVGYNEHLNQYNAMFLIGVLDQERYRYSYGRKYKPSDTIIKLPSIETVNGEYEPDWQWMEDYIKSLPYSACL